MMDEYTYGVPGKYDPNSRMLARKVDKVLSWAHVKAHNTLSCPFCAP